MANPWTLDFAAPEWNYAPTFLETSNYKQAVQRALDRRQAAIAQHGWLLSESTLPKKDVLDVTEFYKTCGLLDERELEIVESDAPTLVRRIKERELSSEQVLVAFAKSASAAHQVTNCLSTIFFAEGLTQARKLDKFQAETGRTVGPLHGLPISLKDNLLVEGIAGSIGLCHRFEDVADKDGVLTSLLRELGAVFYCKTTLPTMMNNVDCISQVWGHTVNPFNRSLACGGSSGGEAVLQACRGSPLGVGTDLGGSIRLPSAFCHQYGLKPSFGRMPTTGAIPSSFGAEFLLAVAGPMSRDLSAVDLYVKAVLSAEPWLVDARCMPIPCKETKLDVGKVRVGLVRNTSSLTPLPPVTRGLEMTVAALRKAGVEVVDFDLAKFHRDLDALGMAIGDGGRGMRESFEGSDEPWPKHIAGNYKPGVNVGQFEARQLQGKRRAFEKKFLDGWREAGLDFILSPAYQGPPPPHGTHRNAPGSIGYTVFWNLMDYPAITFPVTKGSSSVDVVQERSALQSDVDKAIWDAYDPKDVEGAPVALQLIAPRLMEERLVAMAGIAMEALGAGADA